MNGELKPVVRVAVSSDEVNVKNRWKKCVAIVNFFRIRLKIENKNFVSVRAEDFY